VSYNKKISLNPTDVDVIESCLRKELHARSKEYQESVAQRDAEGMSSFKQSISEITNLIGKIHNQKIWYGGDPGKPWVPKG